MKNTLIKLFFIQSIFIILFLFCNSFYAVFPCGGVLTVPQGMSLQSMIRYLQVRDARLVPYPRLFEWVWRVRYGGASLKSGVFELPEFLSRSQMMKILTQKLPSVSHVITFADGMTSHRIQDKLHEDPLIQGPCPWIPEGSLAMDTYHIAPYTSCRRLIKVMRDEQEKRLQKLWACHRQAVPFDNPEMVVIVASILEKEAARFEDRQRIAGVFYKRLREGRRLQSDVTVIYGLTQQGREIWQDRPVMHIDLQDPSLHNTYRQDGLPPTPICHPSQQALEAAFSPCDEGYLYFVADRIGRVFFAKTWEEHQKNRQKIRATQTP